MMTNEMENASRGTMQPKKDLSAAQLREIGATLKKQAEEYYALADAVSDDIFPPGYHKAVAKYYKDAQ